MESTVRICVDARPLAFPGTGNARYLEKMLGVLVTIRPDYEWILLSHRAIHPTYADLVSRENVQLVVDQGVLAKNGLLWMNTRVPSLVKELGANLFWGTIGMLPLFARSRMDIPQVVNFHDLNAFVSPGTMDRFNLIQHKLLDRITIRNAELVLCLSRTTRKDIVDILPGAASKTRLEVVYPGAPIPENLNKSIPRPEFPGSDLPFFLSVGTIEPRKNQSTLVQGYRKARESEPDLPPLVLIGKKGWGDEELYQELKSGELESEGIRYFDSASDSFLEQCYSHCGPFVLPSLHEGFGLPIIEAGLYGRQMIVSDIPIFREVAGPDAIFVEPENPHAWEEALLESYRNKKPITGPEFFTPERWSWDTRAAELAGHLDQLLF